MDRILSWIKTVFLITSALVALLIAATIIYQEDLRGVESNVIYTIQLVLENNDLLYHSPDSPPFNVTQYSPLFYILSDVVVSFMQINIENYFAIRIVSRILSVFFLLLSLYLITDLLQRFIGLKKNSSMIIALAFLIFSFPWYNISRPDVLVLLFFILSVRSVLLSFENTKNLTIAIPLGVYMTLGVMSKITMVFYIAAIGIYLILSKRWSLSFLSATVSLVSLILIGLAIHLMGYDLTYLYENIFQGVDNGSSFTLAWDNAYFYFFSYFGLIVLLYFVLSYRFLMNWKEARKEENIFFFLVISLMTLIFSLTSALKVGSAVHYFNETLLCIMLFIVSFLNRYHKAQIRHFLTGIMLMGGVIAICHSFDYVKPLYTNFIQLTTQKKRSGELLEIKEFLELNPGYFFTDNRSISMSFPLRCILFPEDIHVQNYYRKTFNYPSIAEWSKENLRFIIVSTNRTFFYDLDIEKHYTLKRRFPSYDLYELSSYSED